jgi:hypothetical protein
MANLSTAATTLTLPPVRMLHTLEEIGAILGVSVDKLEPAARTMKAKVLCDGTELYSVGQFRRIAGNPVTRVISKKVRPRFVSMVGDCSRRVK